MEHPEPYRLAQSAVVGESVLDWIAEQLNVANPFPEHIFYEQVREKLRETGRTCNSPLPDPVDPEPSGY